MGINYSSGSSTINGAVATGLPIPSSSQTIVTAKLSNAANGATIYTVTAGKTFYLMGIQGACATANAGIVLSGCNVALIGQAANVGIPPVSGGIIATVAANTAITVTTGGAGNYWTIWGFEQ